MHLLIHSVSFCRLVLLLFLFVLDGSRFPRGENVVDYEHTVRYGIGIRVVVVFNFRPSYYYVAA